MSLVLRTLKCTRCRTEGWQCWYVPSDTKAHEVACWKCGFRYMRPAAETSTEESALSRGLAVARELEQTRANVAIRLDEVEPHVAGAE